MKLAVLSGKGGTGKTLVSVNLAVTAASAVADIPADTSSVYIDCDVEEPNGRLFLNPREKRQEEVHTWLPEFDLEKCTGCRKCVDFCRYHALVYLRERPKVFASVCHSCGGCRLVCPEQAISEKPRQVGTVETGRYICKGTEKDITERPVSVTVVTGELNLGEASAVPVIRAALQTGMAVSSPMTVIDCPPGSSCSVMESVAEADYCLLVVEPTAFGFHNFQMVHELVRLMKKPCGVVINKMDQPYEPLEEYCEVHHIPIHLRILFEERVAAMAASGAVIVEQDAEMAERFTVLWKELHKVLCCGKGGETL